MCVFLHELLTRYTNLTESILCNCHKLLYRFDALPRKTKNSAAGGIRSLDQNVPSGTRTHGLYHSAIRAVCFGGVLRHINMNLMHNQTFLVSVESPISIPCIISVLSNFQFIKLFSVIFVPNVGTF